MKKNGIISILILSALIFSCTSKQSPRIVADFNSDWKFSLEQSEDAFAPELDDSEWEVLNLPHDWSIRHGYQQENTSASTGFSIGGTGWYRKTFSLSEKDADREIWIEFDGVYCKSEVWINGHYLGFRPNGYSSFSYYLTDFLNHGSSPNVIAVKVDHSAYADSRWYTGSGIYRNVRLVSSSKLHIPQWGMQISTPKIENNTAEILIETSIRGLNNANSTLEIEIIAPNGELISTAQQELSESENAYELNVTINDPILWSIDDPALYKARALLYENKQLKDEYSDAFGIRWFNFDANEGFSLNGTPMKIKGVNLHHDAGALGSAVPRSVWKNRIQKLQSIGCNAIRMSHNPHSPELMDLCDEMGMLVMNEFFDEWNVAKGKNLVFIGDNKARGSITHGYSDYFNEWAERDLKDLIRRDFNHPSVIMWSIGNEIEWTFPKYSQAFNIIEGKNDEYDHTPCYDSSIIKPVFELLTGGVDSLSIIAHRLSSWVKEMDSSRPVTSGGVRPSIALSSGYADALDLMGFNYRASDYDAAHAAYPELKIIGSENWGAYSEWKSCIERDFISGIFAWTGFAYLGEAGPWPRKGLEISFFDFAGFKTPRGHFFECLWKDDPKVYAVTTPAAESEFSFSEEEGWHFAMEYYKPPFWKELRKWEWYKTNEHWNYSKNEDIIVQVYSNCDEIELLLNGENLGRKKRADFSEDNIVKWLLPFNEGELMLKGYRDNVLVDTYILNTSGPTSSIALEGPEQISRENNKELIFIEAQLLDAEGIPVKTMETSLSFDVSGAGELLAVDNGWEMNVSPHYQNSVTSHGGRAIAIIKPNAVKGNINITVKGADTEARKIIQLQ